MSMIREWLDAFLEEHRRRFLPHDWPDVKSAEYRELLVDWLEVFAEMQVDRDEATRASKRLLLTPPNWKREHIPMIITIINTMREERSAVASGLTEREDALARSKNCQFCDGGGLCFVFHPLPLPDRTPAHVAAHCVCPYGRWMRARIAVQDAVHLRRIPDFADVLTGRSRWLAEDPAGYGATDWPRLHAHPDLPG